MINHIQQLHQKVEEENDDAETQKEAPFVYYRMSGIPEDLISKKWNKYECNI